MIIDYFDTLATYAQRIAGPIAGSTADARTAEEVFNYELEKDRFDIRFKKSYLATRKWVGVFTFMLVWIWLFAMLFVILCNGMKRIPYTQIEFETSDTIVVTLITTTTINVVAFLTIVIKNLFPEQK